MAQRAGTRRPATADASSRPSTALMSPRMPLPPLPQTAGGHSLEAICVRGQGHTTSPRLLTGMLTGWEVPANDAYLARFDPMYDSPLNASKPRTEEYKARGVQDGKGGQEESVLHALEGLHALQDALKDAAEPPPVGAPDVRRREEGDGEGSAGGGGGGGGGGQEGVTSRLEQSHALVAAPRAPHIPTLVLPHQPRELEEHGTAREGRGEGEGGGLTAHRSSSELWADGSNSYTSALTPRLSRDGLTPREGLLSRGTLTPAEGLTPREGLPCRDTLTPLWTGTPRGHHGVMGVDGDGMFGGIGRAAEDGGKLLQERSGGSGEILAHCGFEDLLRIQSWSQQVQHDVALVGGSAEEGRLANEDLLPRTASYEDEMMSILSQSADAMRVTVRTASHDGAESTLLGGAEEKAGGGSGRGKGLRLSLSPSKGQAGGEGEVQQTPTEYSVTGSALWRDGVAGSVARGAREDGRAGGKVRPLSAKCKDRMCSLYGRVRPLSAKAALNCSERKTVWTGVQSSEETRPRPQSSRYRNTHTPHTYTALISPGGDLGTPRDQNEAFLQLFTVGTSITPRAPTNSEFLRPMSARRTFSSRPASARTQPVRPSTAGSRESVGVHDERRRWERPQISTCSTRRPMTAQAATRAAEGEGAVYSPGGRMVEGFLRQVMTSSSDDDSVEGLEIVRGEPAWSPTRRQQGGGGVGERGHSGSNGTSHGLRVSVWPREEARQSRQGERSTTTTSNGAKNQETIATSVISLDLNELGKTEGRGRGATRSRAGGRSLQGMDEEGGGEGGGSKSNVPDQKHLETERRAHMLRKNQRPEWYRPILRLGINTIRPGRSGKSVMTENMDMARDLEACLNKTLDEKIGVCFTVQHFRAKLDYDGEMEEVMQRALQLLSARKASLRTHGVT